MAHLKIRCVMCNSTKCNVIWTWLPSTECAAAKTKSIKLIRRTDFGNTYALVTQEIRVRVEYLVLLRHPSTCNWFARTSALERVPIPFILRLSPLPYYNYTNRVWVGVLEDFFFFLRIQNIFRHRTKTKLNSVALVRERTIPTERPPPVGEVSANFCGYRGVTWSAQRFPTAVNLCFLDRSRYFLFK